MTCPYDVHLGGIDFDCTPDANDITWVWESLDGWFGSADVRTSEQDRGLDGVAFTTGRHLGRPIVLMGAAIIPAGQPHLWFEAVHVLNAAANLVRVPGLLEVDEPTPLQAYVRRTGTTRMTRRGILDSTGSAQSALLFEVPLKAEDPRKYAQTATTNTALQLVTTGTTTTQAVVVGGTEDTPPTVTIDGPATNPKLLNNTIGAYAFVQWNGTLGGGDTLVIDYAARTILLNGANDYDAIEPTSSWTYLLSGSNSLTYSRTAGSGTTTAQLDFRDAYL